MYASTQTRLRLITALLLLVAGALAVKLYVVQVARGDDYAARADRQYVEPHNGLFDRGSIFFTDKDGNRVSAATLASGFTIALNPRLLEDADAVYTALAPLLPLDEEDFFFRAGKHDDPYEEIANRVPRALADRITELALPGVGVFKEQWRFYPAGTRAAHTLGFVGFDQDVQTGRYGLERYYNDVLARQSEDLYINFFAEVFSNLRSLIGDGRGRAGDIVTHIEPSVQTALEQELTRLEETWEVRSAGGVVIDPNDGRIFAFGVSPTFDPNAFQDAPTDVFANPLVENVFEMGSIVKPLTVAAGLDANVITAKTTYTDHGFITRDGATISNFDGKGRGVVDMQDVLNQSLNTGAAFVVDRLGNKQFADSLFAYGIGEETGIDLPGEVRGLTDNLLSPRDIEYRTASFGQGVATTPIATVRALAALANGGTLITPHIASRIEKENGFAKKIFYDEGKHVLTKETSEEITRMLVRVVDEALAGGTVALPHHSVAAKTGTAQIASPNGGYYDDRFLHSFFGYFPAYEPRFLVFLYAEEPKGVRYASETLTNPFFALTDFLISYYEVPPDR